MNKKLIAKLFYFCSLGLGLAGLVFHMSGFGFLDAPGAFPVIACILFLTLGGMLGLWEKQSK